jgi:2-aminobenzoate-CoA ligase
MFIGSPAAEVKPGSTGRVAWIHRENRGRRRTRGAGGHGRYLAVRGPIGCRYLDDLRISGNDVQDGWNLTGDAHRQDEGGYFWYVSRTDDMIVSSGYNVSGVEVENVLLAHPAVAECAVVGVPDEARGHLVKAFVVIQPAGGGSDALARELQDFVKAELAPYKYPRAIEFVADLPRTLTGKLQRFRLRGGGVEFHGPAGWPHPKGYANAVSAAAVWYLSPARSDGIP